MTRVIMSVDVELTDENRHALRQMDEVEPKAMLSLLFNTMFSEDVDVIEVPICE